MGLQCLQVLTDGLTMHEEQQENAVCAGRGGKEKAKREERFPIELVKKANAEGMVGVFGRETEGLRQTSGMGELDYGGGPWGCSESKIMVRKRGVSRQ